MYFLIEYDRETKKLMRCTPYKDKEQAWKDRFELETKLTKKGKIWTEAVVFEADSRADLEHNHSRYFNDYKGVFRRVKELGIKKRLKELEKKYRSEGVIPESSDLKSGTV
ncbi:MAG: hypothetical protein GDA51_10470 [Ekhidna sp.]|nr:hypothetical protein [Ekhidna sp.]MBC6409642.1 hypothetical protein [Ekhidna sp.]MBC6426866.1 hypothetical protein [Ekhidna sp.]